MSRKALILAAFAALLAGPCCAAPRDDVAEIAQLISSYYFDAARGSAIAADLKRDAAKGAFDHLTDHYDFAAAMTARLRPLDTHFNVRWVGAQAKPGAPESAGAALQMSTEDAERRTNYGFGRTERLPGNIAYIDLRYVADIDFTQKASPSRRAANTALVSAAGADAVILDLRQNGGGAPSMVGYIVSAFVPANADVYNTFHSRTGEDSERPGQNFANPMLQVPLYVLTSARTGSAAEAIAFTLQSCGRATVVGDRSAGAANPGERFGTEHGYSVFVSTGASINPINHRNWEGTGVQPDTEVPAASALIRAQEFALQKVLHGKAGAPVKLDAQWALDALHVTQYPYKPSSLEQYSGRFGIYSMQIESGRLLAHWDRRIPMLLVPLSRDVFFVEGDPGRRFQFLRAGGAIAALEVRTSTGLFFQHINKTV